MAIPRLSQQCGHYCSPKFRAMLAGAQICDMKSLFFNYSCRYSEYIVGDAWGAQSRL
jgi:hypothetical protein